MSHAPVAAFLVRHADAGSRLDWRGDDASRPLSLEGHRQARALIEALKPLGVRGATAVLSSDHVRCRQTVEPLAARLGVEIGVAAALREGAPLRALLALLERCGSAVLCSHGDVIGNLVESLAAVGLPLPARPRWPKASTWVLRGAGGLVVGADYVAPPRASGA